MEGGVNTLRTGAMEGGGEHPGVEVKEDGVNTNLVNTLGWEPR